MRDGADGGVNPSTSSTTGMYYVVRMTRIAPAFLSWLCRLHGTALHCTADANQKPGLLDAARLQHCANRYTCKVSGRYKGALYPLLLRSATLAG